MAILKIYETPDPMLRQISKPVETVTDETRALIADMFETMYDAPGIGLAAVQVGVPIRLLVMDLQEPEDPDDPKSPVIKEPRVFINPEILEFSDHEVPYMEGCLSVPDQYADVMRPDRIKARWLDENGQQHERELDGLLAVCLQHEMDHLEGVLFIDHLSKLYEGVDRPFQLARSGGAVGSPFIVRSGRAAEIAADGLRPGPRGLHLRGDP